MHIIHTRPWTVYESSLVMLYLALPYRSEVYHGQSPSPRNRLQHPFILVYLRSESREFIALTLCGLTQRLTIFPLWFIIVAVIIHIG